MLFFDVFIRSLWIPQIISWEKERTWRLYLKQFFRLWLQPSLTVLKYFCLVISKCLFLVLVFVKLRHFLSNILLLKIVKYCFVYCLKIIACENVSITDNEKVMPLGNISILFSFRSCITFNKYILLLKWTIHSVWIFHSYQH